MLYARGAQKVRDSNEKIEVEEGEPMQEDLACVSLDFTLCIWPEIFRGVLAWMQWVNLNPRFWKNRVKDIFFLV